MSELVSAELQYAIKRAVLEDLRDYPWGWSTFWINDGTQKLDFTEPAMRELWGKLIDRILEDMDE